MYLLPPSRAPCLNLSAAAAPLPILNSDGCGRLSEMYGLIPQSDWGSTPEPQRAQWVNSRCQPEKICRYWIRVYSITSTSWGNFKDEKLRSSYGALKCDDFAQAQEPPPDVGASCLTRALLVFQLAIPIVSLGGPPEHEDQTDFIACIQRMSPPPPRAKLKIVPMQHNPSMHWRVTILCIQPQPLLASMLATYTTTYTACVADWYYELITLAWLPPSLPCRLPSEPVLLLRNLQRLAAHCNANRPTACCWHACRLCSGGMRPSRRRMVIYLTCVCLRQVDMCSLIVCRFAW
mgnify:CR=1 FL=1